MKSESIKNRTKKCLNCGEIFLSKDNRQLFCCSKCSGKYIAKHTSYKPTNEIKQKIRESLINYHLKHNKHLNCNIKSTNKIEHKIHIKQHLCKICGCDVCEKPDICKQYLIRKQSINLIKLGFDFTKIGSKEIYLEYDRIKNYLITEYLIKQRSLVDICHDNNMTSETSLCKIMDMYRIDRRSQSDALYTAIKNGKINYDKVISTCYKHGWHTTWDNYRIFYRSSYELKYAEELDKKKIHYDVETLRIPYYDTQLQKHRISIPDFYIKDKNLIVEIKGEYTYNKQNILDRYKSYIENKYDFLLILEGVEYKDMNNLPETKYPNSKYGVPSGI